MAFAFINSATVESASDNEAICAKPTSTAQNDIMFALVRHGSYATVVPTGWTLLGQQNDTGAGDYAELFYKVAGASEDSTYTWEWSGNQPLKVTISTFRDGFAISDPIDVVSSTEYQVDNATFRAASMTVASVNSPLIFFARGNKVTAITFTKPSIPTTDWVEDYDGGSGTSGDYHEICHMVWSGSGATGNMDATGSASPTVGAKSGFAVALKPPYGVTISPAVLSAVVSVQAPAVSGGAGVAPAVITATASVQAPTVAIETPDWTNTDKNSSSWTNQDKS